MAGTATNQDTTKITAGPGKLWADVAIPAASARMTLHTDGTPESVANPSARQIGLTKDGNEVEITFSKQDNEADELTAPYRTTVTADKLAISGQWLQLEDFLVAQRMTPNGTYSTAAGYKQITIGGLQSILAANKPAVALIWPTAADPTKFCVVQCYQAVNTAGMKFKITRKEDAFSPYSFEGQSIGTRAANDQAGNWWVQI